MADIRATRSRPLPVPSLTTRPFWDAARQGKLALQYDPVARQYQFWPRAIGLVSGQQNLEWRIVSGLGQLYSYTVTHVPTAGFEDRGPYPVGLVELDEGVRIIANLVNVDAGALKIGMRVKAAFAPIAPDMNYFCFEPA